MNRPKNITIVFSVFNESESLGMLFESLRKLNNQTVYRYDLIFVDDGSTDGSADMVRKFLETMSAESFKVRLIRLSRNFGHEAAMSAGIDHAGGDAIICMDSDLQHPAEKIPEMISLFEEGNDIVTMIRKNNRGSTVAGKAFSKLFYLLFNALSDQKLQSRGSDFFLISARIASILKTQYRERNRFLRGIIQTVGFRVASLDYDAPGRKAGKTSYSFLKLTSLTVRAITSFSQAPLRLGIWFGFLFSLFAIILGIYSLWIFLFGEKPPSGYTTIILFLSISFSILFFLIGIIGVYIGHLFEEQKNRPVYLVEEIT